MTTMNDWRVEQKATDLYLLFILGASSPYLATYAYLASRTYPKKPSAKRSFQMYLVIPPKKAPALPHPCPRKRIP